MMPKGQGDFASRVEFFMETFGVGGFLALVFLGLLGVIYIMLRGAGLTLLLLLVSYSLAFVQQGSVSRIAWFLRILCLFFLIFNSFRRSVAPTWPSWALLGYVLLGMLFIPLSPMPTWSLQRGGLLMITALGVLLGLAPYLNSSEAVRTLFRMFVIAGVLWALISVVYMGDFIRGHDIRFRGGGETLATGYSRWGALLWPFMVWAVIQKRALRWRLAGLFGALAIPICLFLSGTRTAIVVAALAVGPLLFRRGVGKTLRVWVILGVFALGVVAIGAQLGQGRGFTELVTRLTQTQLSGREIRWLNGLRFCLENPLLGRGADASSIVGGATVGYFHNAYLSIWYNTGILGLVLVLAAFTRQLTRAFSVMRRATDPMTQDAMRLAFGLLLAMAAMGFVEDGLSSASAEGVFMLFVIVTVVDRVWRLEQKQEPSAVMLPGGTAAWEGASGRNFPPQHSLPPTRASW